jgi:phage replication-related protein YjqB (UPF0714/DUF867 family)
MDKAGRSPTVPDAKHYRGFRDLARAQVLGRDYEISVTRRAASTIAIIAPHGGGIEDGTSEIARAIAGDDFNLYLFEGIRRSRNYSALHLTSHLFDEPECLSLISRCNQVIAIHGCDGEGERVLLGGRDTHLKIRIAERIRASGLIAEAAGHPFQATHPNNICNRGALRRGVQIEVTHSLRISGSAAQLATAVRSALVRVDDQRADCAASPGQAGGDRRSPI